MANISFRRLYSASFPLSRMQLSAMLPITVFSTFPSAFSVTSRVIFDRGMPKSRWKVRNSSGRKLFTMACTM